jgi:transposase
MTKRRRRYSAEFKADTVRLVLEQGRSATEVARELGLHLSTVCEWVNQAKVDTGNGPKGALTTDEKCELSELRRRVKRLEMEKEILKKRRPSSPRKASEDLVHPGREGQFSHRCALRRPRRITRCGVCVCSASGVETGTTRLCTAASHSRCAPRRGTRDIWKPASAA